MNQFKKLTVKHKSYRFINLEVIGLSIIFDIMEDFKYQKSIKK